MQRTAIEDSADPLLSDLAIVFANVNAWLKFAEAKNGALATVNIAIAMGLLHAYVQAELVLPWWAILLGAASFTLIIAGALIALISFFPRTRLPFRAGASRTASSGNIFYFGDIAAMGTDDFLKEWQRKMPSHGPAGDHHRDLAQQIVVNSRIAVKKYNLFVVALWFTLSAIVSPFGAILFYWLLIDEAL